MSELPEHWTTTQLDLLISRIEAGLNVKCEERPPEKNEKGLVKISAVTWGRFDENQSKTLPAAETPKAEALISPGDLLFSRANTIELVGASVIVGAISRQLYLSDKVLRLVIEKEETKKWINYALKTAEIRKKIESASSGNQLSMRNIGQEKLKAIEIPLAPLAEQKQIAAKLDELLAQVNTLKARLDAIPAILKRFRQSVLAAAVSGRLTEGWRVECDNRPKSEPSGLSEFRGKQLNPLPKNWSWRQFDEVASVVSDLRNPLLTPEAIHIAPNHIESESGRILDYTTVSADKVTSPKHRFHSGQILYSKIRPYLCKVAIARFDGLCSADMYPIETEMDTHYLFRWMLSQQFTDWASNAESRSVLPKINQKDLSAIPVPVPPKEEQTEIVRRVEQLFAFADQIEQRVRDAQARVNHLTQSILAKAFRGELTADWRAQNVDLISGDNSAEALLARIRVARAEQPKGKRGRKATS